MKISLAAMRLGLFGSIVDVLFMSQLSYYALTVVLSVPSVDARRSDFTSESSHTILSSVSYAFGNMTSYTATTTASAAMGTGGSRRVAGMNGTGTGTRKKVNGTPGTAIPGNHIVGSKVGPAKGVIKEVKFRPLREDPPPRRPDSEGMGAASPVGFEHHCYGSGQTMDPQTALMRVSQCCDGFTSWTLMPRTELYTAISIGENVNFLCEIKAADEGYEVTFEDCFAGMSHLVSVCIKDQGNRQYCMGATGWVPLGNVQGGMGLKWDPNSLEG